MEGKAGHSGTIRLSDLKAKQPASARVISNRYAIGTTPLPGGTSEVYRAVDLGDDNRQVAIKLFGHRGTPDEILKESYRRELQALGDLRHGNIVDLLGHGTDQESGRSYLVLEWLEYDLAKRASEFAGQPWSAFYEAVGRPVLKALAFAHSRACVHRDVKPANILFSKSGIPKVADFGIAKIKRLFQPGVTLAQYATAPFAPPEYDDGSFSYSRDVFAYAVVTLACLTNKIISRYDDFPPALNELRAPKDVRALLESALCLDNPAIRPQNAAVLLSQLDQVASRDKKTSPASRICVTLTRKALDHISVELGLSTEVEVSDFVNKDIEYARLRLDTQQAESVSAQGSNDPKYLLIGSIFSYRVVVETGSAGDAALRVISAIRLAPSVLDEMREDAMEVQYGFVCGSTGLATVSASSMSNLILALTEWDQDRKVELQKRREAHIYQRWLNLLLAKGDLERKKRTPLRYEEVKIRGNLADFTLEGRASEEELQGQGRKVDLGERKFLCGDVQEVAGNRLTMFITRFNGTPEEIPPQGELVLDTYAAEVAIQRQRIALDWIRNGKGTNPSFGTLIVNPAQVREPRSVDTSFIQKNLDESKQAAVKAALGMSDLLVVEGPPGTGKTTFITEVVLQLVRQDPRCRILLSSQTNVALDNAIEKIQLASPASIRIVRIGGDDETKVASSIRPLLIPHQLRKWREDALSKGRTFVEGWAVARGISKKDVEIAMLLENLAAVKRKLENFDIQRSEIEKQLAKPKPETVTDGEPVDLGAELAEIARQEREIRKEVHKLGDGLKRLEASQTVSELLGMKSDEVDEWARAYFPDGPQAHDLRRLLQMHADWEIRFGRGAEFNAALLASAQVVAGTCVGFMNVKGIQDVDFDYCIVDEASVATPTEALIPLTRSRKAIIVGDQYQLSPFQDPELRNQGLLKKYHLTEDDQKQTLFNQLLSGLPQAARPRLSIQYRMVDPIGKMIAHCFYPGRLESRRPKLDQDLSLAFPRPVTWFSTSHIASRFERKVGGTFMNPSETQAVVALLGRVQFLAAKKRRRYSVAVLTGYNGQKRAFENAFAMERSKWGSIADLQVNTVDAFQGREADVVVFSITRSSESGSLGFLKELERINVALSRGRLYLGIVGDHVFCRTVMGISPLRAVIEYMEENPNDCVIKDAAT